MIDQQPLRGVRVLDLTRVLAGPFCTMNLADLGAEVIKIEVPGRGDDSRSFAPIMPSGDSGYFYSVNRGKRSITIDLRSAEGAAILLELAAKSDVVVENFSPGTMARFKVGYAQLKAANPRIILCSISGFGQTGPKAAAPAYDIVAQALGGTMSITGNAGGEPVRCGVSVGDLSAALYGVIAIMAAIRVRDRDGVGNHVDIAMLDCQVAMLEDALARYSVSGRIPGRIGTRHPSITPFQQFRAADDYFVMGAGNRGDLASLLRRDRDAGAQGRPAVCEQRGSHAEPSGARGDPRAYLRDASARPLAANPRRRVGAVRADCQRRGSQPRSPSGGAQHDPARGAS